METQIFYLLNSDLLFLPTLPKASRLPVIQNDCQETSKEFVIEPVFTTAGKEVLINEEVLFDENIN